MNASVMALLRPAVIAGVLFLSPPVGAQLAGSRSGSSTVEEVGGEEALRGLIAFGECFAARFPEDSIALLAAMPGSRAEADTYRRLVRRRASACLRDDQMQAPRWMVRGAIVEGLYRRGVELPADLAQAPPAPGTTRSLTGAALCYAAGHGEQVRALIAGSRAFSREERMAVRQMVGDFFRCLPPSDDEQWIDSTLLRYRLVEALMKLPRPRAVASGQ